MICITFSDGSRYPMNSPNEAKTSEAAQARKPVSTHDVRRHLRRRRATPTTYTTTTDVRPRSIATTSLMAT